MEYIDLEGIRVIELGILKEIDCFCKAEGIRYSIAYGTLIGAVRHKGFIPWDDDIDLVMPRADYERFISSFRSASGNCVLHCLENDPAFRYAYAKVEDKRTVLKERVTAPNLGIAVDVFPMDDLGNSMEEARALMSKVLKYRKLHRMKLLLPTKKNKLFKKCAIVAAKVLVAPFSFRKLALRVSDTAKGEGARGTAFKGVLTGVYGFNEIMPAEVVDEYVTLQFEGCEFPAFKGYDPWLRSVYGDYMQLPPEGMRRSPHSLTDVYWK